MNDCIFCKIVAGDLPAEKVYEDEKVLAFMDIRPTNAGHVLVIPKAHSTNVLDIEESDWVEVAKATRNIAKATKSATQACGLNLIMNVEPCAGQVVMHPHAHIIPRYENDGLEIWHGKEYESETIMQELANKIRNELG